MFRSSLMLCTAALALGLAATLPAAATSAQGPAAQNGVAITFLANEGVMLSSGTTKVLIDGLFVKYETGFALPADSTRAALEAARAPFDAVDLILVTHHHGDHFHPAPVAAHLQGTAAGDGEESENRRWDMGESPTARGRPGSYPELRPPGGRPPAAQERP